MNPNDVFYENALDASSRLCDLEQFSDHMNGYLQREEKYFRDEAHVDLEIEYLPLFSATFPPILHSSLVVSTVMLIELELRGYSEALRQNLALSLALSDLQGSLLDRFRKYAGLLAGLDLEARGSLWADVVGVFEIRNCIVHSYGSLDRFARRSVIEEFIRRHGSPKVDNDVVKIDEATSALVLRIASGFFDMIYGAALQRFPGRYGRGAPAENK